MSNTGVSVIIVNWHSAHALGALLESLDAQTFPPDRVIVVNNGDSLTIPVHRYVQGSVEVIEMGRNAGFAAANNHAIRDHADTEWVALLNPDAVAEADWLENLIQATSSHPDVPAFGSKQLMEFERSKVDGLGDVYHVSGAAWRDGHGKPEPRNMTNPKEIFSPCGAAALFRRKVFLEVGGFDEDYFCYFEDVDLGFRMRLYGYRCLLVPDACVYHQGSATSGGKNSDFSVYHGHRNLVWTYLKNMPASMFWLYLPMHLLFNFASLLLCIRRRQGRLMAKALWDVLRGLPRMLAKRRSIQACRRIDNATLRMDMAGGWLTPYQAWLERNRS